MHASIVTKGMQKNNFLELVAGIPANNLIHNLERIFYLKTVKAPAQTMILTLARLINKGTLHRTQTPNNA
jgi:hypothetical protein